MAGGVTAPPFAVQVIVAMLTQTPSAQNEPPVSHGHFKGAAGSLLALDFPRLVRNFHSP